MCSNGCLSDGTHTKEDLSVPEETVCSVGLKKSACSAYILVLPSQLMSLSPKLNLQTGQVKDWSRSVNCRVGTTSWIYQWGEFGRDLVVGAAALLKSGQERVIRLITWLYRETER